MNYNFHTHTKRCGHASGTPEQYIKRAIEHGIEYMGFSDHAPYLYPDGYRSGFRVPMEEAAEYIAEISTLREKYRGKIELRVGFEMEYLPAHFEDMLKTARELGAEYLILGQHFAGEERPVPVHASLPTDDPEALNRYVSCVLAGIESGVFTYVAHPDVLNFIGDDELYRAQMRRICAAARETGTPLEINFLGLRDKRNYPDERFWQIAGEEQAPVTFGFDAHDVKSAYDSASLKKAEAMVIKYGLNYIGMPEIKMLQKNADLF